MAEAAQPAAQPAAPAAAEAAQWAHAAEEVKDKVAAGLRVAADQLKTIAQHANTGSANLARRSVELSKTAAGQVRRGSKAAAAGVHRGAESAIQCSKSLGEAWQNSVLPALRSLLAALQQVLIQLRQAKAFQLRDADDDEPTIEEFLAKLSGQLQALASQLRLLPRSAAIVGAVLSLRLLAALNAVAGTLLSELLYSRTSLARVGRIVAVLPGWLGLWHFRHALLQDLPSPPTSGSGDDRTLWKLQAAVVVSRNARQLPAGFWLASLLSGSMALEAGKDVLTAVIRGVLRLTLLRMAAYSALATGAVATYNRRHEVTASDVQRCLRSIQTSAAKVIATLLNMLQAAMAGAQTLRTTSSAPRSGEPKTEPEVEPQAEGHRG